MAETILVTEPEFRKAGVVFGAESRFRVAASPAGEAELADQVRRHGARCVIVGTEDYCGALYQALAETAGDALIVRFGVGCGNVDRSLCSTFGIVLINTPGVLDQSVAEHAVGLMLSAARNIPQLSRSLRAGRFAPATGMELHGGNLCLVGLGNIGARVAAIAHRGLGMSVHAVDPRSPAEIAAARRCSVEELRTDLGVVRFDNDLHAALPAADVVSLHLPQTPSTRHLINRTALQEMPSPALLINTARGPVVDEAALFDALTAGEIAGAALDVFETEPYEPVDPNRDLRTLDNAILTPHIGSNTTACNQRLARVCLDNAAHFLAGDRHALGPYLVELPA